ncbi:hypothetical protein [Mucilaginibacter sp.]|uniref:hypothetical protein n=1 Tax=Mucilaginibacter sp. TaxID=1882438 RepID=UPI003568DAA3
MKLDVQPALFNMQYLKEYQGFSIDLKELNKVFNLVGKGPLSNADLLKESGFGMNKVRGIKEYLSDFGLLGEKNSFTTIGQLIYQNDPRFKDPFTQWVMLYHWSMKENNPFLNFLINDLNLAADDTGIIRKFKQWAERNMVKTDYEGTKLNGLINRTKAGILDPAAFQSLNLFHSFDDVLQRSEPYNVNIYLIAYILYTQRRGRTSMSFQELLDERNNVSKFFNWNSKELEANMVDLMNIKMTRLVHHADLHLIEFAFNGSPCDLIEKYYEEY